MTMTSPLVFLSYSRKDHDAASWFHDQLATRGIAVWIDREGIREGERFHRAIEEAVHESWAVVVLLSRNAADSSWVDAEWQQALDGGKLVIPVVLEDCSVPRILATRQVLDASSDRVEALERLANRIRSGWRPGDAKVGVLEAIRDDQSAQTAGLGYRAHREQPSLNLVKALLFPFRNIQDVWRMTPLAISLTVFPPLGVLLARGWRLDVVRRFGAGDPEPIPRLKETGRHFALGLLLALLRTLFLAPAVVLLLIFSALSVWELVVATGKWVVYASLGWGEATTLRHVVTEFLVPAALQSLAPLAYLLLAWPLYRACIIRYALTGRSSALFELHKAAHLVARHADGFLIVFFFWLLMTSSFIAASLPLIATGVGILGVSGILAPFHYWMTAYLYGALAVRVRESTAHSPSPHHPRG